MANRLGNDVARCNGVEDDGGWREGCENCLRRIASKPEYLAEYVWMMEPPKVITFFCEYHIEGEKA